MINNDRSSFNPIANKLLENSFFQENLGRLWSKKGHLLPYFDGKFHHLGPDVFDQGLHKGNIEPGFRDSIESAHNFAFSQLNKPLSIETYTTIHRLACQHFKDVNPSIINVKKENIDKFRATSCRCFRNLLKHPYQNDDPIQSELKKVHFILLHSIRLDLFINDLTTESGSKRELNSLSEELKKSIIEKYNKSTYFTQKIDISNFLKNGNPYLEEVLESIEQITKQMGKTQRKFNLPKPFATLKLDASDEVPLIFIYYNYQKPEEIQEIVKLLIDEYNDKMERFSSNHRDWNEDEKKQALRNIAELFQNLEWLHPFYDGQGRTDLVLLSKLLVENGFNPAVLYFPYLSTFEPLEKWILYLEKGMDGWRELQK